MNPYDDARYQEWVQELQELVAEFLETEGNTEAALRDEIDNAIGNARP